MKKTFPLLLIAATVSQSAMAAFYVDDDPPQAAVIPAAYNLLAVKNTPPVKPTQLTVEVIFYPGKPSLGPIGRSQVLQQIHEFRTAEAINIVAYPSGAPSLEIHKQRGLSVKAWLVANGVNPNKIFVREETELPEGAAKDTVAVSSIQKAAPAQQTPRSQPTHLSISRTEAPVILAASTPAKPVINDQVKLVMAQRIVSLAQTKVINAADAIDMIADLLKASDGAAIDSLSSRHPTPAPAFTVDMPRMWTLDSAKSLQENINEWAAAAKWEQPKWTPAAPYRVGYNSTLNGTFLDVLRQIAEVVPSLDFEANKTKRTLTITESRKQ